MPSAHLCNTHLPLGTGATHGAGEETHVVGVGPDQAGCWGKSGQAVAAPGLGRGIWSRPPCEPWPNAAAQCCTTIPILWLWHTLASSILPTTWQILKHGGMLNRMTHTCTHVYLYMFYTVLQILPNTYQHSNSDTDHPKLMHLEIYCLGNFDIGIDPIRSTLSWGCHVVPPINAEK